MKTRNNIYYDLNLTEFYVTINKITYCFSSKNHMDKFNEQYIHYREKINDGLSKRFGFMITVNTLADISLYKQIEKRGFLIKCSEGETIWKKEHLKLNGVKVTKINSTEQ
jgi:YHS domain-containing protein